MRMFKYIISLLILKTFYTDLIEACSDIAIWHIDYKKKLIGIQELRNIFDAV